MKKHRLSLIFLGLLVSVLFISFFSGVSGAYNDDIDYTFDSNTILDTDNPEYYNQTYLEEYVNFNVRNATELTETYNATYSFTNETGLIDDTISWVDTVSSMDYIEVVDEYLGHSEVIFSGDAGTGLFLNSFGERTEGYIEWWFNLYNVTAHEILFKEDASTRITLRMYDTSCRAYKGNGAGGSEYTNFDLGTEWNHFKIKFSSITDLFSLWINGILRYDEVNFSSDADISYLSRMYDYVSSAGSYAHLDAIDYYWKPGYIENRNMIPITTIENSRKEMDKFEFALEGINDAYDLGDDNPSGWTDIESPAGDQVNIGSYPADIDKKVSMIADGSTDTRGLFRVFSESGEFIELSFEFDYTLLTGTGSTIISIDSKDATNIVYMKILTTGEVSWYDHVPVWHEIFTGLTTGEDYIFNFMISYEMELCILKYYIDGVYTGIYMFPLRTTGKEGLAQVDFKLSLATVDEMRAELDNIGVYVDGISMADTEYCYLTMDVGLNWSFQENNLFWMNASGYFGIYAVDYVIGTYGVPHVAGMGQPLETVEGFHLYEDDLEVNNLFSDTMTEYPTGINNTFLVFYLSDANISLTSLSIDGVLLKEGSNEYALDFELSNADGYFWVENEELHYYIIYNDIGLEYMQATFDITDVVTENRSVQFTSDKTGSASGAFLRINYTDDTSTILPFRESVGTTGLILPQTKSVGEIVILITDDDTLNSGIYYGYIKDISFIFYPDITVSITTFSLLVVLIPLIVLIVPTVAMEIRFGKSAVVPMFILMSIVCFATELIPAWLFFIIMIASGAFLIGKKTIGDEF